MEALVVWDLVAALERLEHDVLLAARPGTSCPCAEVIPWESAEDLHRRIPRDADLAHFHCRVPGNKPVPHIVTMHGNPDQDEPLDLNTVFLSTDRAARHGSDVFVYNGLHWPDPPSPTAARQNFHFLGKAAWRRKNVRGAIAVTRTVDDARLDVLGGSRINFSMGFRCTLSPRVRFHGVVHDAAKRAVMARSLGLVFAVTWHEPFGLSIIKRLFCGCPVFGTPYGSLPELVPPDVGHLSMHGSELADAVRRAEDWDAAACTAHAMNHYNADRMAADYVRLYERVAAGATLHDTPPQPKEAVNPTPPWFA